MAIIIIIIIITNSMITLSGRRPPSSAQTQQFYSCTSVVMKNLWNGFRHHFVLQPIFLCNKTQQLNNCA